ncbi:hypothetical protein C8Q79DRAFT_711916 [Trametes meyenii]|nr:hypothetical protein C8Q79DRAFT_711916 [Trametes meyenii]
MRFGEVAALTCNSSLDDLTQKIVGFFFGLFLGEAIGKLGEPYVLSSACACLTDQDCISNLSESDRPVLRSHGFILRKSG